MGMMGPLKSEISRYRRRKQHSLDGSVAGMPSYHGTSSSNGMAADAHVGQAPAHFDLYDPFGPMYDWAQPDYRPPEPWFVGLHVPSPSPERIAGSEQVQVVLPDAVRQQIEINRAVTSFKDDDAHEILFDKSLWGREPSGEKHEWFGGDQVPQDMVDTAFRAIAPEEVEPPAPEPVMEHDLLSAMASPDPLQLGQGLEALVQEEMLQQNPNDLQDTPFAQEQLMYEEEMKQLLDPFAMPGFGPG